MARFSPARREQRVCIPFARRAGDGVPCAASIGGPACALRRLDGCALQLLSSAGRARLRIASPYHGLLFVYPSWACCHGWLAGHRDRVLRAGYGSHGTVTDPPTLFSPVLAFARVRHTTGHAESANASSLCNTAFFRTISAPCHAPVSLIQQCSYRRTVQGAFPHAPCTACKIYGGMVCRCFPHPRHPNPQTLLRKRIPHEPAMLRPCADPSPHPVQMHANMV